MKHVGYFDKSGKLHCDSFRAALNAMKERDCHVVLTVGEFKSKRTNPQNRYYFGVVVVLIAAALKEAGWEPATCTKEVVHEMLKREFLTVDEHVKDGVFLKRTRSTTELTTEEFSTYIEHCARFAAENLSVTIPAPNEQMEMAA